MGDDAKNRVPQIVLLYWIIKIASTTLGETGADMFSMTYKLGYAQTILIFMAVFLTLLAIKLMLKDYNPIVYWLLFTASAIVGTGISDFIDRTLKLGYTTGSALLVALLIISLAAWYKKEKTINVDKITTTPAEIFYWTAFLIANTLGTAAGDFTSDVLGLGFRNSAILITALLALIILLHFYTKTSKVLLFWLAFVLTRPFGATFGDFLTKPVAKGGIAFGTIGSSLVFALILLIAIMKEHKVEKQRRISFLNTAAATAD